jgi:hypothetical protein
MEQLKYYKIINGYENYMIGRNSIIYNIKTGQKIKPLLGNHGYYCFNPSNNGKQKCLLIHRILAELYIPNDNPSRTYIDHIDRNKTNNNLDNLRWVTNQENMMNMNYKHISRCKKSGSYVVQYRDATSYKHRKQFKQLEDAENYLEKLRLEYPKKMECN